MTELRQDRTSGEWVLIAPERALRPYDSSHRDHLTGNLKAFDPNCPFCPGNETKLPGIIAELPAEETPGWRARVIPNKYPMVQPSSLPVVPTGSPRVTLVSHGYHEVVIESPRHDADLATMTDDEVAGLVSVYRQRFSDLITRPGIETVVLFRNHGTAGGASLHHPHSQIVAFGIRPPRLHSIADWMKQYWQGKGRCVTCDELALEIADDHRVVENTQYFLALVPFAAALPYEVWLVPKRHQSSFTEINKAECDDLARLLRNTLLRLKSAHDDPAYNFVVESFDMLDRVAPHVHWRLRIAPSLVTRGGFELGTGMQINPSSPEADARILHAITTEAKLGSLPPV
jgi:UDPglucose--hexose-1-phosphate uridylyltransferase